MATQEKARQDHLKLLTRRRRFCGRSAAEDPSHSYADHHMLSNSSRTEQIPAVHLMV